MNIELDEASAVPPYEQVRRQIEDMVRSGVLAPGTRLPTIRQLAGDLGLATNTVARAYRELEAAGHLVTRVRAGTVVAADVPQLGVAEVRSRAREAARNYLAIVRALGLSTEDAVATLRGLSSAEGR